MITETHIAHSVRDIFKKADLVVPNVSWGFLDWEADLLVVTQRGRLNEVEIKTSVADFRADAKKDKWLRPVINQRFNETINCFYYAMPLEVYEKVKDEIPEFSGAIVYYHETKKSAVTKKPKINRAARSLKDSDKVKLARLLGFRYWNLVRSE